MQIHPYYFSTQKRIFDFLLAVILLLGLSPLFLLIGATVFLTAGLPVFFKQKRVGSDGTIFTLFKFRTMKRNAAMLKHKYQHLNEAPEPMFKIHNDPRYTGIGKWLARSGLDELPQLWNILWGEMSFVGPRPLPVNEVNLLESDWRRWRERVKPGIFSQWALSGDRHQSLAKWKKLEEATLKAASLKNDLKHVFNSIKIIIFPFFNP